VCVCVCVCVCSCVWVWVYVCVRECACGMNVIALCIALCIFVYRVRLSNRLWGVVQEARDVRDNIEAHLTMLEHALSEHSEIKRRDLRRAQFQRGVKGAAVSSMLSRDMAARALDAAPRRLPSAMLDDAAALEASLREDEWRTADTHLLKGVAPVVGDVRGTVRGGRFTTSGRRGAPDPVRPLTAVTAVKQLKTTAMGGSTGSQSPSSDPMDAPRGMLSARLPLPSPAVPAGAPVPAAAPAAAAPAPLPLTAAIPTLMSPVRAAPSPAVLGALKVRAATTPCDPDGRVV
jgi:hypothetical protein